MAQIMTQIDGKYELGEDVRRWGQGWGGNRVAKGWEQGEVRVRRRGGGSEQGGGRKGAGPRPGSTPGGRTLDSCDPVQSKATRTSRPELFQPDKILLVQTII